MIDVTLMLAEGRANGKHGGSHKPILTFFRVCHFAFVSAGGPLIITLIIIIRYYPSSPAASLAVSQPPLSDTHCANQTQPDIMAHCEDEMQRIGSTYDKPP